jgi:hypothetical protein
LAFRETVYRTVDPLCEGPVMCLILARKGQEPTALIDSGGLSRALPHLPSQLSLSFDSPSIGRLKLAGVEELSSLVEVSSDQFFLENRLLL